MYIFSTKGHEDKCPVCKFKVSDFLLVQRVGCSFCYLFLSKALKNLIVAVQDEQELHVGKFAKNSPNLLYQFFCHVLDEEAKKDREKKEDCQTIKKILEPYF